MLLDILIELVVLYQKRAERVAQALRLRRKVHYNRGNGGVYRIFGTHYRVGYNGPGVEVIFCGVDIIGYSNRARRPLLESLGTSSAVESVSEKNSILWTNVTFSGQFSGFTPGMENFDRWNFWKIRTGNGRGARDESFAPGGAAVAS